MKRGLPDDALTPAAALVRVLEQDALTRSTFNDLQMWEQAA